MLIVGAGKTSRSGMLLLRHDERTAIHMRDVAHNRYGIGTGSRSLTVHGLDKPSTQISARRPPRHEHRQIAARRWLEHESRSQCYLQPTAGVGAHGEHLVTGEAALCRELRTTRWAGAGGAHVQQTRVGGVMTCIILFPGISDWVVSGWRC